MVASPVRAWARAQRGCGAVMGASRARFELELGGAHGADALVLGFAARHDEEPFCVRATVAVGERSLSVTFDGMAEGLVPAGGSLASDPVPLGAAGAGPVALRYELVSEGLCVSGFDLADYDDLVIRSSSIESPAGELAPRFPATVLGLEAIDLIGSDLRGCVAFFGDSICEQGTYFRPAKALLAERGYAALNLGISGNRLLRALELVDFSQTSNAGLESIAERFPEPIRMTRPTAQAYGFAGVERFAPTVLSCPGLVQVSIALGVNDLYIPGTFCGGMDELPSAGELLDGYRALAAAVDAAGADEVAAVPSLVWLSITPFCTEHGFDAERARIRLEANEGLSKLAAERGDAFVPFDGELAIDATEPAPALFQPDLLHPNTAGGARMFECIRPALAG